VGKNEPWYTEVGMQGDETTLDKNLRFLKNINVDLIDAPLLMNG
jgi:hypothetical protein